MSRRPQGGPVLRRLAFIATVFVLLAVAGLWLLLFRWSGDRGKAPATRLFVPGRFGGTGALVRLELLEAGPCYRVRIPGHSGSDAQKDLCPEKRIQVWTGDAMLEIELSSHGVPSVSLAGARVALGDWIGSGADPEASRSPRFPLRGYGVPYRAAQRVRCPGAGGAAPRPGAQPQEACIEVADRLDRLAIVRERPTSQTEDNPLQPGRTYRLRTGDVLWLGLVPFTVRIEAGPKGDPILSLERDNLLRGRRPEEGGTPAALAAGRSGDRRWLGRLWPVESLDPAAARQPAAAEEAFEIYPSAARYEPYSLSRERTNLEGEDILQRLIDGQWLCLEDESPFRVGWRDLDRPGCSASPALRIAVSDSERRDYQRARFGDAAPLTRLLLTHAEQLFSQGPADSLPAYLFDPTPLPFAFDWRLGRTGGAEGDLQPWPVRLWGIRFGAARFAPVTAAPDRVLPEIDLRATTAEHVLQVLRDDHVEATLYLPRTGAGAGGRTAPGRGGTLCLGPTPEAALPLDAQAGGHYPLGSVFLPGGSLPLWWQAEPATACGGCLLRFAEVAENGRDGDSSRVQLTASGSCPAQLAGNRALSSSDRFELGNGLGLRYVRRGKRPWVAMTDRRTGSRVFAGEFYDQAGLAPLLGGRDLSGIEAALHDFRSPSGAKAFELSIDGDLQLAAMSIVRENFEPQAAPAPRRAGMTAVVLDSATGEVLATVSWWPQPGTRTARRFTAWELGTRQAAAGGSTAFSRKDAVGSSFKIAVAYTLVNDVLVPGRRESSLAPEGAFTGPFKGTRGRIFVVRDGDQNRVPGSGRQCLGLHSLPTENEGFGEETFQELFARSCNGFFILAGLRHAGLPVRLVRAEGAQRPAPGEMLVDPRNGEFRVVVPAGEPLADRIRRGLAADLAGGEDHPPRSLYGTLLRLGFQPEPFLPGHTQREWKKKWPKGTVPGTLELDLGSAGGSVRLPLRNDWFRTADGSIPALRAGRDFEYPTFPSPGRFDVRSAREIYDGNPEDVHRLQDDGSRPELHFAQLMIGQSNLGLSALGLAAMYAPAARADGRSVSPCLFRAGCADRDGPRVVAAAGDAQRRILRAALRRVMTNGTGTRHLKSPRLSRLAAEDGNWGGKTGTYDLPVRGRADFDTTTGPIPGLTPAQWRDLVEYACGVKGVERPAGLDRLAGPDAAKVWRLAEAGPGAALGAQICDSPVRPLHPAGIQDYRTGSFPALLDELAHKAHEAGRSKDEDDRSFHAFVTVGLPSDDGAGCHPAQGLVVAVLVDDPNDVAVRIGGEIALAAERWASTGLRRCP